MAKKHMSKPVKVFAGILTLFLIACATIIAGPIFSFQSLEKRAEEVKKVVQEKQTSGSQVDSIRQLYDQMQKEQFAVDRAAQLTAEARLNQYQNKAVRTLRSFANSTGVTIKTYTFAKDEKKAAVKKSTTKKDASTSQPESGSSKAQPTVAAPSTSSITITLDASTKYVDILRFMNLIERNPTQMQIKKITLKASEDNTNETDKNTDTKTKSTDEFNAPYVSLSTLELEVYTR